MAFVVVGNRRTRSGAAGAVLDLVGGDGVGKVGLEFKVDAGSVWGCRQGVGCEGVGCGDAGFITAPDDGGGGDHGGGGEDGEEEGFDAHVCCVVGCMYLGR